MFSVEVIELEDSDEESDVESIHSDAGQDNGMFDLHLLIGGTHSL